MDAPGRPPDDARTLLAKDARLRKGVLGYAYKVTHRIEEARAAAQEAMTRVLEGKGWYAWDPRGQKTLFSHLCSVIDSLVANERARAHNSFAGRTTPVTVVMWLKKITRVRGVIASLNKFSTCAALMTGFGRVTFLIATPYRLARSCHGCSPPGCS